MDDMVDGRNSPRRADRRANRGDGKEPLKTERIDVIWARTGERVWPLDDRRRTRVDRRTLRERLHIPRDHDDDEESPLLAPATPSTPETPAPQTDTVAPPRGPLSLVADQVAADEGRCLLLTDAGDPDLARQAAEALVDELGDRGITSAHLHVGPANHGEAQLAGAMDEVDAFVEEFGDQRHPQALATGAIEPSTVSDTID
ncbi:MAG: hypothetical protein OES57_18195, partial [Acidimicrobiia bacterium]|nr:hypothetical protein [Acidimicrobiia bacterium]